MADDATQISFLETTAAEAAGFEKEGAVIISKRDEAKYYADLFADLEGKRWKIRPEYEWSEFSNDFKTELSETVRETVEEELNVLLLKYFRIERVNLDPDGTNEIQLNIWATGEDGTTVITDDDGTIVTTDTLSNQITTGNSNGTLSVAGVDVPVRGLRSAAYTESNEYVPIVISNWTDL